MANPTTDRTKLRFSPFRVPRSHREKLEQIGEACHIAGSRLASLILNAFLNGELKPCHESGEERRHADRRGHADLQISVDDDAHLVQ